MGTSVVEDERSDRCISAPPPAWTHSRFAVGRQTLWGALGAAVLGSLGMGFFASAQGSALPADSAQEVRLAPPPLAPQLGPRYAPVTVEIQAPLTARCPEVLLRNLLRRLRAEPDVRLRFSPQKSDGPLGAELLWAACDQQPAQCFPFLRVLCESPQLLAVPKGSVQSSVSKLPVELWQAAARLGLDVADLKAALAARRYQRQLGALWSEQSATQTLPEVFVNGKRVLGAQQESRIFDEIDAQRLRAQDALRRGTRPSLLLESLRDRVTDEEARTELRLSRFGLLSRRDPIRSPELGPIADRSLPCQGPALAPTTLFYFLQLETSTDSQQAKAVLEVWSRHRDRVRLCVLHAPSTPAARRTSELLAQVATVDERLFFRVLEDFVELMRGRYFIRRDDLVNLLRRRGELGRAEATGVRGMIQLGADLDQIRRLGLRAESQVVLGGRQLGYWNVEILDAAIQKETRRGLLAKLRSRTAVLVGK